MLTDVEQCSNDFVSFQKEKLYDFVVSVTVVVVDAVVAVAVVVVVDDSVGDVAVTCDNSCMELLENLHCKYLLAFSMWNNCLNDIAVQCYATMCVILFESEVGIHQNWL